MHCSKEELINRIDYIKAAPKQTGTIDMIVCRPATNERKELSQAELDIKLGLCGDNWLSRGFKKSADGNAHPDMQLNLMNSRAIEVIAKQPERWKLAGDQFFVDLDLSPSNLPPGTQLALGDAIIEVTAEPHLGCQKFIDRFGRDAALFVNSSEGRSLNLRGINAKVIRAGTVSCGANISKIISKQ